MFWIRKAVFPSLEKFSEATTINNSRKEWHSYNLLFLPTNNLHFVTNYTSS